MSRLLTIWILLRFGYEWVQFASHEKVIEDNKERYYLALRETQNSFSKSSVKYDPWINFFCDTVFQQMKIIEGLLKKESPVSSMNQNEVAISNLKDWAKQPSITFDVVV